MNPPPLPSPPARSGLALASCLLGIAGIVLCLGPLAGIPAVICGHSARARIRRSGGGLSGNGLAVAGLVTGYFSFVWAAMLGLVVALAISNLGPPRPAPGQDSARLRCVANLKMLEGAKATWALENRKGSDAVPADRDLFGAGRPIREKPVCPAGGIYTLNAVNRSPQCSVHGGLSTDFRP